MRLSSPPGPPAAASSLPGFGALIAPEQAPSPTVDAGEESTEVSFARDIRPLLDRPRDDPSGPGCGGCHYATNSSHVGIDLGGMDLTTLGALRRGGATSGEDVVVAGDPSASVIVQKIRGTYPFGSRMPRGGPPYWAEEEIDLFERWIAEGAKGADPE